MLIGRIEQATRTLGAPEDMKDCQALAIRDIELDGNNVMVSAWFPTPEEMTALNAGQPVYLHIWGKSHPPVFVGVKRAL